jgi:hypothetical protein
MEGGEGANDGEYEQGSPPPPLVGAVCWWPAISLPTQSIVVGEVGRCMGVLWRADGGVGVLRTGPVAAGVRVYSSVSHL